jgi:hypothetical protein
MELRSDKGFTLFLKRYAIRFTIIYFYATLFHLFSLIQIFKSNFCVHCISLTHGTVQDTSSLDSLITSFCIIF